MDVGSLELQKLILVSASHSLHLGDRRLVFRDVIVLAEFLVEYFEESNAVFVRGLKMLVVSEVHAV